MATDDKRPMAVVLYLKDNSVTFVHTSWLVTSGTSSSKKVMGYWPKQGNPSRALLSNEFPGGPGFKKLEINILQYAGNI